MLKQGIMCALAAAALASCATDGTFPVPGETYEECRYLGDKTEFAVWAPGAETARINLYRTYSDTSAFRTVTMKKSSGGLWKATVKDDVKGTFYCFQVKRDGNWLEETPGMAAKAVCVNGTKGAVIDWSETNPEGWDADESPAIAPSDIIVYEMHHRDFSIHPSSGIANKGKYLALTETGTTNPDGLPTGIDHLKALGITYIQILPSYDYFTVDESRPDVPQYNWGYDPQNYNVPEGSYSTDASDPLTRIREFKQMVQALHREGFRVIMDVVYNHVFSAPMSGFEKLLPGYFFRMNPDGTFCDASGCNNETASEKPMYRKYMVESLEWWMNEYHIDGFRFDLMAIHDIETMNLISERLHAIDPDVVLYGEGWAASAPALAPEIIALKDNTYLLDRIGAFSDNIRDALRGPLDCSNGGFMAGVPGCKANVEFGIAGGVSHPQVSVTAWAANPLQHVSYVSCHDDHCMRDRLEIAVKASEKERIEMAKLAQTAVLTSQGLPFIFNGEEVYRHKQGTKNSYKSPDSINAIDWNYLTKYRGLNDYIAAVAAIRHAHPGFCLADADLVREKLEFIETGNPCAVAFRISGLEGIDSAASLVLLLNGSSEKVSVEIPQGLYSVLARNGAADPDGLAEFVGKRVSANPTSATILAEITVE
ncbi:MAG: type I pullulanase [Candidatus Cryptobacteroides sp.]